MHFEAKKTNDKKIKFDIETYNAIVAYQESINAKDGDAMFPPGIGHDPTNKYVIWLQRFFKKHDEDVQSHDFRTTAATMFYEGNKDLVAT